MYNDPMNMIKLITYWIMAWPILQTNEQNKKVLELGTKLQEHVASDVYKASQGWRYNVPRLEG